MMRRFQLMLWGNPVPSRSPRQALAGECPLPRQSPRMATVRFAILRLGILCALLGAAFAASAENVLWIESENTMGVHRSKETEAGAAGGRVIPVPWTRLWTPECGSTNCVSLSNLVSVAKLPADLSNDRIKYFDTTEQVFKLWTWHGSGWGYIEDRHWRDDDTRPGETELLEDTTFLDRGRGLWLNVLGGGDVYLIGQSSTNAPVSVMSAENPYGNHDHVDAGNTFTENFVVNPCDTDVDLLPMVTNAVIGDEINVTTPTNSLLYWYRNPTDGGGAAWCTLKMTKVTTTAPWGAFVTVEKLGYVKSETLSVPYGAGVWYSCVTNTTHNPPPEIRWGHQEEFRK